MKLSQPKAQVETIIQNLKKEEKNLTYFIHKNGPLIIVNVENVAFRHNYSQ